MIFLDFDGVLYNTVKEAYAVSMIAIQQYQDIEQIDFESNHYNMFLTYRYLVGPAWNYKYLLQLIEKNSDDFENEYFNLIKNISKEDYLEFEKSFFETREKLKKYNYDKWLSLNQPYEFLYKIKSIILENSSQFVIVTTKDKKTVHKLLEVENILIDKMTIYDKNDFRKYNTKANIIKKIINANKSNVSLFIDDNKHHLNECTSIQNLVLLQADWGYISPKDSASSSNEVIEQIKEILKVC